MIVELFADREEVQQCADAIGEPIEYHEDERCGRWCPIIESRVQRNEVVKKIDTLSHRFRLIVQDCEIDGIGPSVFLRPGAEWNAYYRVAAENGRYELLDEAWECDDQEESDKVPIYRNTVWRFRDGEPCDPLLIIENKDPDDLPSMVVYQCGDDLSVMPDRHDVPHVFDWPKEGF
jgi:hypothetical protein